MKRGTPRHPKIYALLRELGLPVRSRPTAIGYLEMLWHFTAEFAPQGDIGKYSDEWIEAALDWTGKRGRLIEALTNSGWCEKSDRFRLIVHDWHDHADGAVGKRLTRLGLKFVTIAEKVTGQCQPSKPIEVATNFPALPSLATPTPSPVVGVSDYPKTHAAITGKYPTADVMLTALVVQLAMQAYVSVDRPKIPSPTDEVFAEAVEVATRQSNGQTSAGLFKRTVPTVITNWAKNGRQNGHKSIYHEWNPEDDS